MTEHDADLAWRWLLRLGGLGGVIALAVSGWEAPVAAYVLLGGMMGLPSVWNWQRDAR